MDFVTHFYDNPAYPNNTYTVAHPTFDDHSRIIAISDIHGNLPYFRGLVEKLHLRADDSLVLLGDLVEKGPESLATLRYAMALREKCRVYPVLGNCDFWHLWVDGCDMEWDVRTFAHLLRQKATARSGLILEMCAELGEVLSPDTDLAALKALLREAFALLPRSGSTAILSMLHLFARETALSCLLLVPVYPALRAVRRAFPD